MADEFVEVKIEGMEETLKSFQSVTRDIKTKALTQAMWAGIKPMAEAVSTDVPVVHGDLAVHLKVQVHVDDEGDRGALAVVDFGKEHSKARWVEYGHEEVSHEPKHQVVGEAPPHPFIRPAFERTRDEALVEFKAAMDAALADVLKDNNFQ